MARYSSWLEAKPVERRSGQNVPALFVGLDGDVEGNVLVEVGEPDNIVSVPGAGSFFEGQSVWLSVAEDGHPTGVIELGPVPEGVDLVPVGPTAVLAAEHSQVLVNHAEHLAGSDRAVEEIRRQQSDTNLVVEEFGKEVERSSISVADAVRTAQNALTTAAEGVPAVVKVESSRGTAFKNNTVSTDLRATVFYGPKTITTIQELWDEFGGSAFLEWWWRREDDAEFGLISASDDRLSRGGFWLTVSPDDVDAQTTFRAVLNV